jgi:hypothetical protein
MDRRALIARAIRGDWGVWAELSPARQEPWLAMADRVLDALEQERQMEKQPRLVEGWRSAWRWWSVRFALFASAAISFALHNFDLVFLTLSQAPPEVRGFIPIGAFILMTVVTVGLRLWNQKGRTDA